MSNNNQLKKEDAINTTLWGTQNNKYKKRRIMKNIYCCCAYIIPQISRKPNRILKKS